MTIYFILLVMIYDPQIGNEKYKLVLYEKLNFEAKEFRTKNDNPIEMVRTVLFLT